jgi:putative membrane protein
VRRRIIILPFLWASTVKADVAPAPQDFSLSWNGEPWLLAVLALAAVLHQRGILTLRRVTGRSPSRWRVSCFYAGWLSLFGALVSPLDALSDALFSAHMVQHELLMLVVAPLLVLAKPLTAFAWALPSAARKAVSQALRTVGWRTVWRRLTRPATAWSLHALALWGWHAPALFQASLAREGVHLLQHSSFLLSALLFWGALLRRRPDGTAVLYVFTTLLHTGLLGALLTFAPTILYPAYLEAVQPWDITALEDQQLGGLIMWVPAGAVLMLAGLGLFGQWLLASERSAPVIAWQEEPDHEAD